MAINAHTRVRRWVLIHGIGEQRPMATLRGLVDALLEPGSYEP